MRQTICSMLPTSYRSVLPQAVIFYPAPYFTTKFKCFLWSVNTIVASISNKYKVPYLKKWINIRHNAEVCVKCNLYNIACQVFPLETS